mmetsp:Transcript_12290/g.32149  ORF Transcript_12290/g.32149 Transcript_12290/m.32149 type:complete len:232 (+) Transcript_12290:318-1013(+)
MSSLLRVSVESCGVHRTSAAMRLSSLPTSAASCDSAARRSPVFEISGRGEPDSSSAITVTTMYVAPPPEPPDPPRRASCSHLERSVMSSRRYAPSVSERPKSPDVSPAVRADTQSEDERSSARHVSDTSSCSPTSVEVSAVAASCSILPNMVEDERERQLRPTCSSSAAPGAPRPISPPASSESRLERKRMSPRPASNSQEGGEKKSPPPKPNGEKPNGEPKPNGEKPNGE